MLAESLLLTHSSRRLRSGFSVTYNFWSHSLPITVILVSDDVGTGGAKASKLFISMSTTHSSRFLSLAFPLVFQLPTNLSFGKCWSGKNIEQGIPSQLSPGAVASATTSASPCEELGSLSHPLCVMHLPHIQLNPVSKQQFQLCCKQHQISDLEPDNFDSH